MRATLADERSAVLDVEPEKAHLNKRVEAQDPALREVPAGSPVRQPAAQGREGESTHSLVKKVILKIPTSRMVEGGRRVLQRPSLSVTLRAWGRVVSKHVCRGSSRGTGRGAKGGAYP